MICHSKKCQRPRTSNPHKEQRDGTVLVLFADEIDAIGTKRYESHSGGEREIQRTMLELLNQMDGFDAMSEVKVSPGYIFTSLGGGVGG